MERDKEKAAIIPYAIIDSLAQIDNIFEMRLFGWVLAKAQSVLKMYNKDLKDINLQHALNLVRVTMPARYVLPAGDTNYKNITKAFELSKKRIEYQRGDHIYMLNIIAFPEIYKTPKGVMLTCVIHNELWHALLNNFEKGYRLAHLPTFLSLKSTYSVIFYLLVSQQKDPMYYKMETLKRLTGCDTKPAYRRNNNFLRKVIEPAKRELDRLSVTTFEYSLQREGRGGGYGIVILQPRSNTPQIVPDPQRATEVERQRLLLDPKVQDILLYRFGMTPAECERCEPLLRPLPLEQQLDRLDRIGSYIALKRPANPKGYLYEALRHSF